MFLLWLLRLRQNVGELSQVPEVTSLKLRSSYITGRLLFVKCISLCELLSTKAEGASRGMVSHNRPHYCLDIFLWNSNSHFSLSVFSVFCA
jgi:hypothetical protein